MFMICIIAGVPGDSHVYDMCYRSCFWRQSFLLR